MSGCCESNTVLARSRNTRRPQPAFRRAGGFSQLPHFATGPAAGVGGCRGESVLCPGQGPRGCGVACCHSAAAARQLSAAERSPSQWAPIVCFGRTVHGRALCLPMLVPCPRPLSLAGRGWQFHAARTLHDHFRERVLLPPLRHAKRCLTPTC